jgi:hypothetical protein
MKKIIFLCMSCIVLTQALAQKSAENLEVKYRRSSLYTLMIDDPTIPYANVIKESFEKGPLPQKFNDHNLGSRTIPSTSAKDESENITNFLNTNNIARDIVAKWFNRTKNGDFNMELIKARGSYDATAMAISIADKSQRGRAMLADAGEELIKNTFVLINDYNYVSEEEVADKAKGWLKVAGNLAASAGVKNAAEITDVSSTGVGIAGKGYVVKTTAHLFRLVWNDEVAAVFYNDYWADSKTITPAKKKAFDESTIFKLEYIGSDVSSSILQSSIYTAKTNEQLIERATIKAVDAVIVKLQKNHDEFKTKTPLFSGEPITAKIGLKEGLSKDSRFDVLEQREDKDGKTEYVIVGSVKVDNDHPIWDNMYGADEENKDATTDRTYFKKVSGRDFYPGMLIVQKKGK